MKIASIYMLIILPMILLPLVVPGQERTLNIIYTGRMDGELEPCGCSPKTDFGGVARLSGYIAGQTKEQSPYILIDAGNFTGKDTPQGRLKAETMLKAFSAMKYDAVAFLTNEKAFPDDFFPVLLKKYEIPAISDAPRYRRSISIKRDTFDLNISVDPEDYQKGKVNILLTDLTISEIKLLKGWDVIIVSSGEILEEPLKANETVVVTGYPKGKKLGILTLEIDGKGRVLNFKHRWQSLGKDIKEDINVRKILNEYNTTVARLLKDTVKPLSETSYLGLSKCGECHQPFVESWKKTRHAGAFPALERVGRSGDPECLRCHTVGFEEAGGFNSIETTPGLANVQCEVCHGPGKEHLSDLSRPMKPVTKSICLKCHTKSNSPDFKYPAYLEKIKHN